jgi:CDP-diacylglycerol--inositol 3-phosphatidyltransferase
MDLVPSQIFFFVPQWIGYSRILCSAMFIYYATISLRSGEYSERAIGFYCLSFAGDLFDGMAARKFNQCSTFGGLLDMVTDRCTTMSMIIVLTWIYTEPMEKLMLLFLVILDISSHWFEMYAAVTIGHHHKSQEANRNKFFIVRLYYTCYPFFGYCCVGAEFTYIFLYALPYCSAEKYHIYLAILKYACAPACALKNFNNICQLCSCSYAIAEHDVNKKKK